MAKMCTVSRLERQFATLYLFHAPTSSGPALVTVGSCWSLASHQNLFHLFPYPYIPVLGIDSNLDMRSLLDVLLDVPVERILGDNHVHVTLSRTLHLDIGCEVAI